MCRKDGTDNRQLGANIPFSGPLAVPTVTMFFYWQSSSTSALVGWHGRVGGDPCDGVAIGLSA